MAGPFKMKGWGPFTKKSPAKVVGTEGEYVDDPSGASVEEGIVSNTKIDNIKQQISAHQKIQKENKPWGDKMANLREQLHNATTELARSKGLVT